MNYWSILVTILKIFAGTCWLSLISRRFAFTISLNAFSCRNEDTRNFAVTLLNVNGISLSITFLISLDTRPNLAPPTKFLVGKFGLALLHWEEIICGQILAVPIKLLRRALYDDGQMINSNVTNHVTNTRVEFVFNKHGCRWRAEMYRFESI